MLRLHCTTLTYSIFLHVCHFAVTFDAPVSLCLSSCFVSREPGSSHWLTLMPVRPRSDVCSNLSKPLCCLHSDFHFHCWLRTILESTFTVTWRAGRSRHLTHWVTLTFAERNRRLFSLGGFANLSTKIAIQR